MSVPQIVGEAVAALISGDVEVGERMLRSLDVSALDREKEAARSAARLAAATSPGIVSLGPHGIRTPSPAIQFLMFLRDGFTCRYRHCQRKTIIPPIFRALSLRYPDLIQWNKNWRGTHPVVWLYSASVEHVVPWVSSRSSHPDTNLITTCYWCNQIKSKRRREDLGWDIVEPVSTSWDGLASSLSELVNIVSGYADGKAITYFNAWVRASQAGRSSNSIVLMGQRPITVPRAIEAALEIHEPVPKPETTPQTGWIGIGNVAKGMVVQAVAANRVQARNYRVEDIRNGCPIGREFWYTGSRYTDGFCVYSTQLRLLADVRKIYSANPPVEHLRRSQQPPGALLT